MDMESRTKHIRQLAEYHRARYEAALDAGKAARTPLALSTAQSWMDHHGKLALRLEAAL